MSGINNYFSNNNIFNGTEIPTQGKFDVGDIIVNIGENAEEEPMWMCIEAGEPGVWKVVGKVEDIDLSGYQEKTDENLVTESKDLVGAINELFQSANNGKELIASAIGEPLNAEDTFSAMSTDINSLLSTFKTNMMNNGVTVESSDKFKSLIDKIATLADNEGKGIQYAEGVVNNVSFDADTYNWDLRVDNLSFKPNIILIKTMIPSVIPNSPILLYSDSLINDTKITPYDYTTGSTTYFDIVTPYEVNDTGFYLPVIISDRIRTDVLSTVEWVVIGVGEEDTTLRDSLASILQEEGVSVTEEDDMASLISKVNEEFDRQVVPAGDATAEDVVGGKTFINSTGQLITGTGSKGYSFDVNADNGYMFTIFNVSNSSAWTQSTYDAEVPYTSWDVPVNCRVEYLFGWRASGSGTFTTRLVVEKQNGTVQYAYNKSTTKTSSDYDEIESVECILDLEEGDRVYITAKETTGTRWTLNSIRVWSKIVK